MFLLTRDPALEEARQAHRRNERGWRVCKGEQVEKLAANHQRYTQPPGRDLHERLARLALRVCVLHVRVLLQVERERYDSVGGHGDDDANHILRVVGRHYVGRAPYSAGSEESEGTRRSHRPSGYQLYGDGCYALSSAMSSTAGEFALD